MGRYLGRVREVDVALEQLPSIEARMPPAAPSIAEVRRELEQRHASQRRRLVKNVEKLSLDRLRAARLVPSRGMPLMSDRRWPVVGHAIVARAERLREAVDTASGVYFPRRAHRVRVEAKKLRYLLELVGNDESTMMVKRLRRVQDVLGQLHDHQVLGDTLRAAKRMDKADRRALVSSVEAQCDELFQAYLTRRAQLLEVADGARAAALRGAWRPRSVGGMLLTASAVALPSALFWFARPSLRSAIGPHGERQLAAERESAESSYSLP